MANKFHLALIKLYRQVYMTTKNEESTLLSVCLSIYSEVSHSPQMAWFTTLTCTELNKTEHFILKSLNINST